MNTIITNSDQPLYYIGICLFHKYDLINKYKISPEILANFLKKIENGYKLHNNPYHNNLHGADVLQTFHHFLTAGQFYEVLTDLDILAALTAAIIHDYEHPGVSNFFEQQSKSKRALLYNDKSILENYHLTITFTLLLEKEYNIFENLSPEE